MACDARGVFMDRIATPSRTAAGSLAVAAAGGAVTGVVGAIAYYDSTWRPVAHTFSLWIGLAVVLAAGSAVGGAMVRVTIGLLSAVVAFFYGKDVMYAVSYGGPYDVNRSVLAQWCVLALVAGALLGWVFARIGRDGWPGAAATAFAVGLVVSDAYRRVSNYPDDASAVLVVAGLALLAVALSSRRAVSSWLRVLALLPAAALSGWLLVSGPDLLEQLLLAG